MMRGLAQPDRTDPSHSEKLAWTCLKRKQTKEGSTHFIQNANSNSIVDILLSQWFISLKMYFALANFPFNSEFCSDIIWR